MKPNPAVNRQSMALCMTALLLWSGAADRIGAQEHLYKWTDPDSTVPTIATRVAPPPGFTRIRLETACFATWLRHLPVKSGRPPIKLYDGRLAKEQDAHHAVLDIDVGNTNLQQCADAAIRLRAEYFYSRSLYDSINFCFTSGDSCCLRDWIEGLRPDVDGNQVTWIQSEPKDSGYTSFREYLDTIFMYAGSYSLARDLQTIDDLLDVNVGDLFILPGFPGHVVIVVDIAINENTDQRLMLLAQGYTPAQDFHILKNWHDPDLSPWYEIDFGEWLVVPHWRFPSGSLRRFR